MRIVLDTNILIAALITKGTPPDRLYEAWRDGRYTLVSCEPQFEEVRLVTRRAGVKLRIIPAEAGRMVNDLRRLAQVLDVLPNIEVSPDPFDNFLLGLAEAGVADYLVTGDKHGLLALERHKATRIVTARDAVLELFEA